jgi:hypothetical protein
MITLRHKVRPVHVVDPNDNTTSQGTAGACSGS